MTIELTEAEKKCLAIAVEFMREAGIDIPKLPAWVTPMDLQSAYIKVSR